MRRLKEMETKMASVENRVRHLENSEGTPIRNVTAAPPPLPDEYLMVVRRNDQGVPTCVTIKEELKLDVMMYQNKGRPKMAKVLVEKLFTKEERMTKNVNGARGKSKLDPVRMEAIKEAVFLLEPSTRADRDLAWNACVRDIDTMNRGLKRDTTKEKTIQFNLNLTRRL